MRKTNKVISNAMTCKEMSHLGARVFSANKHKLAVKHKEPWGTVCADNEERVACKEMSHLGDRSNTLAV